MSNAETRKPKFRVGQVVRVSYAFDRNRPMFGKICEGPDHENRYMLLFWDVDNGDTWQWDYEEKDLRALTKRESGK
jgi:hypothetical protein